MSTRSYFNYYSPLAFGTAFPSTTACYMAKNLIPCSIAYILFPDELCTLLFNYLSYIYIYNRIYT